jgi:hypothetical protein
MPYYVYAVRPLAQLTRLAGFDAFAAAASHAKALRAAQAADDRTRIKVIFADSALAAEDLLLQVRDAAPAGDD